ncbi:formylglycine-generating enzyme family protein [Aeromicrobium massiliense]|uniref:formylglycine-generating enzyme family protein n=1 Tax=Aeromicrobium massiliense TaxID=1464554 RepID=UPI0002E5198B|nr:formylglycine-generating enzyme family protein [Aeromicrobium massiliense]
MTATHPVTPGTSAPTVLVPGGVTTIGNGRFYPEERPVVPVSVGDMWFDVHPVTNAEFAAFVAETGHITVAERELDPADFPGADPAMLVPGSQVFTQAPRPVPLTDWTLWWRWQPGAQWRHPDGPGSTVDDRLDHPVVHVGWEDALAYARWAGKDLATEAEWEHAARGGHPPDDYAWGTELHPDGTVLANTWQGPFPWRSDDARGHHRTSPVGSYPLNGYGLADMIGNVWEWTRTPWTPDHRDLVPATTLLGAEPDAGPHAAAGHSCCGGHSRTAAVAPSAQDVPDVVTEGDRRVTKGGSHLCSPYYCQRYRPAARQGHGVRDTASHVGFRCVTRAA